MHCVEVGSNWHIDEDFISPDLAAHAGRQALLVSRLERYGVTPFAARQEVADNPRRQVIAIDTFKMEQSPKAPVFLRLLETYGRTEEAVVNGRNRFYIDPFDTGGHAVFTSGRIAPQVEKTLIVPLLGRVLLEIEDARIGGNFKYDLEEGTALHIEHFLPAGQVPTKFAMSPNSVRQPLTLING